MIQDYDIADNYPPTPACEHRYDMKRNQNSALRTEAPCGTTRMLSLYVHLQEQNQPCCD